MKFIGGHRLEEELRLARQELEATRRELQQARQAHRETARQLQVLQQDCLNLLANTRIPALFVDRSLCLRRLTPSAGGAFSLAQDALGKPLDARLGEEELVGYVREVIDSGAPFTREVSGPGGSWLLLRIHPFFDGSRQVEGAVLTLLDLAELKGLEERFRLALHGTAEGMWDWDLVSDRVWVSSRLRELLGEPGEEGTDSMRKWWDRIHPEDVPRVERALEDHPDRDAPYEAEFRMARPDQEYRWFRMRAAAVHDAEGKPVRLVGSGQDVTEHRQAEEKLKATETLYRTVVETLPVVMWQADADGQMGFVNRAGRELTGLSQAELQGCGWTRALHPDDVPEVRARWQTAHQAGQPYGGELRFRRPDGSYRTLAYSANPVRDDDGSITGWVGIDIDITEQRLRELCERTKTQILSTFSSTWEVEPPLREMLELLAAHHDYPASWVYLCEAGELARSVCHGCGGWHPDEAARQAVERKQAVVLEKPPLSPSPESPPFRPPPGGIPDHLLAVPILHHGQVGAVLVLASARPEVQAYRRLVDHLCQYAGAAIHSLRQYRQLEGLMEALTEQSREILRQNRELETANRLKSEFLANMSHELRTPLNAVIGFSELLADGLAGPLDPRQREYAQDIFRCGTHLLSLINDILDLSKIEAGKVHLELERVDLAELLQSCLLVVREKACKEGLRLDLQLEGALGWGTVDPIRLKQILYNLLSNAVKFTPRGGRVALEARREGDALVAAVSDTGIGIPAVEIPRILEPFEQLDSSYSKKFQGTGLGLALVRRLLALFGGELQVESEVGRGSRFCLRIPGLDRPCI